MSTALCLLLALAAASTVGAFLPQEPTHRITLEHWRAGVEGPGPGVTAALDALGLTDVFGSWWFLALTAVLLVSLGACLVVRWRTFVRAARRPPPPGRHLERLTHRLVVATPLPPTAALDAALRTLARRRWRVARVREAPSHPVLGTQAPPALTRAGHPQVAAQRAGWREAGSLVFHSAIPLVLAAALAGHALGFTGQVDVVEGEAFADTAVAYDRERSGRWWRLEDHRGFSVRLEEFTARDHPSGVPAEFLAAVTVHPREGGTRSAGVELNRPLRQGGMRVHLARHGLAPHVVVSDGDEVVFDGHVRLDDTQAGPWVGLAPVGAAGADAAVLDLVLLEHASVGDDGRLRAVGVGSTPVLLVDVYPHGRFDGDVLDRRGGAAGATTLVSQGGARRLDGTGWTVELVGVDRWVGFQVTRVPGSWLLLASALLALAGLTVSLLAYPRRMWVEARPAADGGTTLLIAGAARDRPWAFARAFPRLAGRVEAAVRSGAPQRRR